VEVFGWVGKEGVLNWVVGLVLVVRFLFLLLSGIFL
jgi:hypothetical protein